MCSKEMLEKNYVKKIFIAFFFFYHLHLMPGKWKAGLFPTNRIWDNQV